MKLTADEKRMLRAISSLADKVLKAKPVASAPGGSRIRTRRSRAESARLKKDILAAVRKGTPVTEISETFSVTGPYVYQLINKTGAKRRKRA